MLFDAFWWSSGPPSGRNVLGSLVTQWRRAFPEDRVTIARPTGEKLGEGEMAVPAGVDVLSTRIPQHAISTTLELSGTRGQDVVISQNFTPWRSDAVRAVFVHDVLFQAHPEWFTPAERRYLSLIPRLARRADLVFTSSRSESERIIRFNPRLSAKTHAVGLGLAEDFRLAAPTAPARRFTPGSFLLTVGRLNVRKNLEFLVEALLDSGTINPDNPLVVVGEPNGMTGTSRAFDRAVAERCAVRLGYAATGELKWLYSNCAAFVFPSLDEGFGLPVLEAAWAGAPIALSAIPSFLEFGAIGEFFDPREPESAVAAVKSAIAGGPNGQRLAAYNWAAVVGSMRERISEALVARGEGHAHTIRQ